MASKSKKFIPFDKITKNSSTSNSIGSYIKKVPKNIVTQELVSNLAVSISIQVSSVLNMSQKDWDNFPALRAQLISLKESADKLLFEIDGNSCGKIEDLFNVPSNKTTDRLISDRQLENGGMAPPKLWDKNVDSMDKFFIIKEAKKLYLHGKKINRSNNHFKSQISLQEFTDAFKKLDDIYDYNGAFLVNLLKNEIEIDGAATAFHVDLSTEKKECEEGANLITSIYDIRGSSGSEEKKFLLIFSFDRLSSELSYSYPIFTRNDQEKKLSDRQKEELIKFCKAKNIKYKI